MLDRIDEHKSRVIDLWTKGMEELDICEEVPLYFQEVRSIVWNHERGIS